MDSIEASATILSILYVIFVSKQKIVCWWFGIVANCLFVYTFIDAKLPMQAVLFALYIPISFYGIYQWNKPSKQAVRQLSMLFNLGLIALIGLLAVLSQLFVNHLYHNQQLAMFDSISSWAAIIATILTTLKYIDNWVYWMIINSINIYLFSQSQLWWTTGLAAVYLALSFYGFWHWFQDLKQSIEEATIAGNTQ